MSEVEHLVSEAMKLSAPERAELVERLLETVTSEDVRIDPAIDAAWLAEARRRSAELRSGAVEAVPWEEVERQLDE
jgi:putative addiction module component (TIGR02574 family)